MSSTNLIRLVLVTAAFLVVMSMDVAARASSQDQCLPEGSIGVAFWGCRANEIVDDSYHFSRPITLTDWDGSNPKATRVYTFSHSFRLRLECDSVKLPFDAPPELRARFQDPRNIGINMWYGFLEVYGNDPTARTRIQTLEHGYAEVRNLMSRLGHFDLYTGTSCDESGERPLFQKIVPGAIHRPEVSAAVSSSAKKLQELVVNQSYIARAIEPANSQDPSVTSGLPVSSRIILKQNGQMLYGYDIAPGSRWRGTVIKFHKPGSSYTEFSYEIPHADSRKLVDVLLLLDRASKVECDASFYGAGNRAMSGTVCNELF